MLKYLKMAGFVAAMLLTLTFAITPSLLVFVFPQENLGFNILLFYSVFLVSFGIFTPIIWGLYNSLRERLLETK